MVLCLNRLIIAIGIADFLSFGLLKCEEQVLRIDENPEEFMTRDEGSCPTINPRYPLMLPHPQDCSKFYICDSGSRYLKECPAGLHFNPVIKACDYPETVKCDKSEMERPKGKIIGDKSNLCPAENSKHPVLIPHPDDCSKFYICDRGSAHLKECHPGLHFNTKLNACDYPQKAGCDAAFKELPKGKQIGDDLNLCPAENSEFPVLVPHPDDCNKFYICDSGLAHLKECQPDLHFNPKINTCDYPRNAGCSPGEMERPKGRIIGDKSNLCPAENSKHPVLIPHPDDCSKFYICDRGSAHLKECHPGLHFNTKLNACDYPQKAGCDAAFKELPKGKQTGDDLNLCPAENSKFPVLVPHPDDCNKFYICDSGLARLKECQPDLHFNPKINTCDYPRNAGCTPGVKMALSGVPSPYCPSRNGKTPIFFRHSTNCSVYYMCGNGLAYEFICPSQLHFNLRKKVCDYEWNAGCENTSQ